MDKQLYFALLHLVDFIERENLEDEYADDGECAAVRVEAEDDSAASITEGPLPGTLNAYVAADNSPNKTFTKIIEAVKELQDAEWQLQQAQEAVEQALVRVAQLKGGQSE